MRRKNLIRFKKEILDLYSNGESIRKIANIYGVAYSSIRRILVREGVARTNVSNIAKELPDMYRDYQNGMNFAEIARKYDRDYSLVSNHLKKEYGAVPLARGASPKYAVYRLEWKSKYESGESLTQLAKEYDVPVETIRKNIFSVQGQMRTIHEANKIYNINSHYFNNLDESKAYKLGVLMARLVKVDVVVSTTAVLRMAVTKVDRDVFEGWIDKIPTVHTGNKNENYIEIRDDDFYLKLARRHPPL